MAEPIVLDTNLLIDQRRGVDPARLYISNLVAAGVAAIHPVSKGEVIVGARDQPHLAALVEMLSPFRVLTVKNSDFLTALGILERHILSVKMGWADCLIAATCLRLGLPLATLNVKHFRAVRGLSVIQPY